MLVPPRTGALRPLGRGAYHAAMRAGAARVDITPPLPVDVLGYVRRDVAPRRVADPLMATGVVIQGGGTTSVIIGADLANLAPGFADDVRDRVAAAVEVPPANVLLNSSHSHAAPWPGAQHKLGGEVDGWTRRERDWWASLPDAFASVAA